MIGRKNILLLGAVMLLAACGGMSDEDKAVKMVNDASQQIENGEYEKALQTIDSLRAAFPDNIDARRQALSLHQQASLKLAQKDLANTDSLMAIVSDEYSQLKAKVEQDRKETKATLEETQRLNITKAKLDSLKVRFDVQCAKIKYIHKKQKE